MSSATTGKEGKKLAISKGGEGRFNLFLRGKGVRHDSPLLRRRGRGGIKPGGKREVHGPFFVGEGEDEMAFQRKKGGEGTDYLLLSRGESIALRGTKKEAIRILL